jgi:DNA polymerase-3 subunit epsilon
LPLKLVRDRGNVVGDRDAPGRVPFAVIDVETTGFSPWLHDRVVEVAIVVMHPDEGILDEFVTLVNPDRDVGRTDIHGIRASDVSDAPTWEDIAGDVATRLDGAVVAAHNLRFDLGFLVSEFTRVGHPPPAFPGVCTLRLARQYLPGASSHKLHHCCAEAGIEHDDAHSALGDARAAAHLLSCCLRLHSPQGPYDPRTLGCEPPTLPEPWCGRSPSGRSVTREIRARARDERSYLARLVEKLPPTPFEDPDQGAYLDLLDRVVEDRRVTPAETEALLRTASEWGLTRAAVFEAHHRYLASLVKAAHLDSVVTDTERADLELVCDLLGLHRAALDALMASSGDPAGATLSKTVERMARAAAAPSPRTIAELRGKRVCFTGTFVARRKGSVVTRDEVEQLAADAGMEVKKSVTKTLDLLVAADVESLSSKARRAREIGVAVIEERAFWKAIGIEVEV